MWGLYGFEPKGFGVVEIAVVINKKFFAGFNATSGSISLIAAALAMRN